VLVPYERGDLVARVHSTGEVLEASHLAEGTRLRARVDAALAAELTRFGGVR
jgi:GTPase